MSKHTPGPWVSTPSRPYDINGNVLVVKNAENYPTAFVPAWDDPLPGEEDGTDEARANARLIAAAPEMLEALKAFVAAVDRCIEHDDASLVDEITDEIEQMARAAIAKAEGHQ